MLRDPLNRRMIFITGAPRSGTSLVTKVLDAHPDIAVLMENIFGLRRRHWSRPQYWNSRLDLRTEVEKAYLNITKPIIGNKVCTPDVWSADDILMFCRLFADFKIVFVVRDPVAVSLSRLNREDYANAFSAEARSNMLLDFRSRCLTYTSSWRQSIEAYWSLRDGLQERVGIVYYDDLCADFEREAGKLCDFVGVPFSDAILNWHEVPHLNAQGILQTDLKYQDRPVFNKSRENQAVPAELKDALRSIESTHEQWRQRAL